MELTSEFHVSIPIAQAWNLLTDLGRVAPCVPGAQLLEVDGEIYRGVVKVQVGPVVVSYNGVAYVITKDEAAHAAVLHVEGREVRGQGDLTATLTATLTEERSGTSVAVVTDLAVTGKVAQFGRGLMTEVSGKFVDQFVELLESSLPSSATRRSGAELGEDPERSIPHRGVQRGEQTLRGDEAAPINLLAAAAAASPAVRRLATIVASVAGIGVAVWWIVTR